MASNSLRLNRDMAKHGKSGLGNKMFCALHRKYVPNDVWHLHSTYCLDEVKRLISSAMKKEGKMIRRIAKKIAREVKADIKKVQAAGKPKRTSTVVHHCKHGKFVGFTWNGHRRTCKGRELVGPVRSSEPKVKVARPKLKVVKFGVGVASDDRLKEALRKVGVGHAKFVDKGLRVEILFHCTGQDNLFEVGDVITAIVPEKGMGWEVECEKDFCVGIEWAFNSKESFKISYVKSQDLLLDSPPTSQTGYLRLPIYPEDGFYHPEDVAHQANGSFNPKDVADRVLDRGTLLKNIHNAAEEKVRTLEAELKTAREYLERISDEKLEFVSKVDALVKPEASK